MRRLVPPRNLSQNIFIIPKSDEKITKKKYICLLYQTKNRLQLGKRKKVLKQILKTASSFLFHENIPKTYKRYLSVKIRKKIQNNYIFRIVSFRHVYFPPRNVFLKFFLQFLQTGAQSVKMIFKMATPQFLANCTIFLFLSKVAWGLPSKIDLWTCVCWLQMPPWLGVIHKSRRRRRGRSGCVRKNSI